MSDDEGFIVPPPSVIESASYKEAVERAQAPAVERARDDIVFFPGVPGIAAPTRAIGWHLVLPTGESVPVDAPVIIGRRPDARPDRDGARLLAVTDPAHSVSKTHAVIEADATGLWVTDAGSTNGTFVVGPGVHEERATSGSRLAVPPGATVELGEYVIRVERD